MCALPKCKELCLWDAKGKKWWKYCCPDHAMAAKGEDTACPAFVIKVVDASISAEEIVAGTTTYITPIVTRAMEDLEAKAATLARRVIGDDELQHFDVSDPDDMEEMDKIMLIVAFEQVSGRAVSKKDRTNIEDALQPGMLCASALAEIYTGKHAQEIAICTTYWRRRCAREIANLYNALAQEMRARCARVQQEIASQIEIDELLQQEATKLGQDRATKMEVGLRSKKSRAWHYGVVLEVVDLVFSQVVPPVEKSRDVVARVKTANQEAWHALMAKHENKKKAADAHAAVLLAHSQARADKLRARKERAVGIVSSIIDEIATSVSSASFRVHDYVEDMVLDVMAESCIVACAIRHGDFSVQGEERTIANPRSRGGRSMKHLTDRDTRGDVFQDGRRQILHGRGVRRRITLPTRYLGRTEHGGGRLYRRRMHDFLRARVKRTARKHLIMTRYSPTVR